MKHFSFTLFLAMLLSMVGTKVSAQEDINGINYAFYENVDNLTATVIGHYEYKGKIVIPSSVTFYNKTYKVTSIGDQAFQGCIGLTSISIPNSVTSIGDLAFDYCSGLTSISIPNSVTTIGEYAFSDCSGLTSITIPNSVTSIGNSAFQGCSGLTSITIPNSMTSIVDGFFRNCSRLTSFTIPNSVTSIESGAFAGCSGLTSITIPNSVTSIGEDAFLNCSGLTSITIPNSVTSIGDQAFCGCIGLKEVISKIEEPFNIAMSSFSDETYNNCKLYVPAGTADKYKTKEDWNCFLKIIEGGPTWVTIVKDIYFILDDTNLTATVTNKNLNYEGEIVIPSSVTCDNETYNVTSIGDQAFEGCSGLTSITIPNSVTSIGDQAFDGCSSLKEVVSKIEDPFDVDMSSFSSDTYNGKLYVPEGTADKYKEKAGWVNFTEIIEGEPTAVTSVKGIEVKTIRRYTMDCKAANNLQRGINIIQMSDGTTKKVVTK